MLIIDYTIEFFSYWCTGTGIGQGRALDHRTRKDVNGLPILPGKTIKGLFRDALQTLEEQQPGIMAPGMTGKIMGRETKDNPAADRTELEAGSTDTGSLVRFSNAVLLEKDWFLAPGRRDDYIRHLYRHVAATALDDCGMARDKHLRNLEVCLPVTLKGSIELQTAGDDEEKISNLFTQAAPLIRKLGFRRHRGYGRCAVTITRTAPAPDRTMESISLFVAEEGIHRCRLELELLEDCIVTAANTSQCRHYCLDYIPGSKLFGIAAGKLFAGYGADIFFSGKVRFGPGLFMSPATGIPCFPVPLSFHTDKEAGAQEIYNSLVDDDIPGDEPVVQLRSGEMEAINPTRAKLYQPAKNRCLKSARNRDIFGVARENQLFNFESLHKGQKFLVTIEADSSVDEEVFNGIITTLLEPEYIYLGRSRHAEFGKARLSLHTDERPYSSLQAMADRFSPDAPTEVDANLCVFYLVSDLALFRNNTPTLLPFPEAFGLDGEQDTFIPGKSFIRTRSYSPWNSFYGCAETERQVIVRGSVISFRLARPLTEEREDTLIRFLSNGIGGYRNEGLGTVLLNPAFVLSPPDRIKTVTDNELVSAVSEENAETTALTDLIGETVQLAESLAEGKRTGEKWGEEWFEYMEQSSRPMPGISQWATIRQLAVSARGDGLVLLQNLHEFTTHGQRTLYWQGGSRQDNMLKIMINSIQEKFPELPELTAREKSVLALAVYQAARDIINKLQDDKNSSKQTTVSREEAAHETA